MIKLRIKHNISSLNTYNKLDKSNKKMASAMEKLASGLRINRAADDAAGLAISEKMRAQIRGLEQAEKNIQDAISLIQTAESGLSEIGDPHLMRMRELAIEAANDTMTSEDRLHIQKEIEQLKQGINEIANNTHFNQINLLNQTVQKSVTYESILREGKSASVTTLGSLPLSLNVMTGVNDTFEIQVNGTAKEFQLAPGTYSRTAFLEELNSQFATASIPLTASFSSGTSKIAFTSPAGDYTIESIAGNGIENYLLPTNVASRTGGISIAGLPMLSPGVEIETGVNDTLTFYIDSNQYSITIAPGDYTVYGASQSSMNINSPFLEEINQQLQNTGVPVKAQYIYYANPDPPFYNGAGLYLTASESKDGSSHLPDGSHTFGNFGGSAKSILFDQIVDGWSGIDASTIRSGSITTIPSKVQGEADLSDGLTIEAGHNDTLSFDMNGITHTITLNSGLYNGADLMDEINDQFTSNNLALEASLNSLNRIVISQTAPSDGDIINHFSGNALFDLFFNVTEGEAPVIEATTSPAQGFLRLQVGANHENQFELTLFDARTSALGLDSLTVLSGDYAENAILMVDKAIQGISSERGKLGAYQNRLEYSIQNTIVASENLCSAESRIRDVDYALAA